MDHKEILRRIRDNVGQVIVGKEETLHCLLCALLCSGHVLIEDNPGLGKTKLALALASSLGCSFQRIQFTPDTMPSDVVGFSMYNMQTGEKEIRLGSVMHQIVLADEINRTGPKTQAALLQVMQEHQVTIDGETFEAPTPFMVLATQNPIETVGTYPLPEAQLDRFMMKLSMGYPSREEELEILARHCKDGGEIALPAVVTEEELHELQKAVGEVTCSPAVTQYIVRIAEATRERREVRLGVSPRGSIALMQAARANALAEGRDYVLPDDVQRMVKPVLAHRLLLYPTQSTARATEKETLEAVLQEVLRSVPVPVSV